MVAASQSEAEAAAQAWLGQALVQKTDRREAADILLQAWWRLKENKPFGDSMPDEAERQAGWRTATQGRVVELGWLARKSARAARYEALSLAQIGL